MPDLIPTDQFETIEYRVENGVGHATMNRPDVHNAFNYRMQLELRSLWRIARTDPAVRCILLTGAGDKAFCSGIDREESMGNWTVDESTAGVSQIPVGSFGNDGPWHFDDPGLNVGPKANDLWKPVVCAVNGIACGGAFYLLGEADIVIAADHATFFDPHVTFGMVACFESIQMAQKMPFHETMRMALMGSYERMSAQRAFDVGFVTEVVPVAELAAASTRVAETIAAQPPVAVQGTVRAVWAARDLGRKDALDIGRALIKIGSDKASLLEGQKSFQAGGRITPRVR